MQRITTKRNNLTKKKLKWLRRWRKLIKSKIFTMMLLQRGHLCSRRARQEMRKYSPNIVSNIQCVASYGNFVKVQKFLWIYSDLIVSPSLSLTFKGERESERKIMNQTIKCHHPVWRRQQQQQNMHCVVEFTKNYNLLT